MSRWRQVCIDRRNTIKEVNVPVEHRMNSCGGRGADLRSPREQESKRSKRSKRPNNPPILKIKMNAMISRSLKFVIHYLFGCERLTCLSVNMIQMRTSNVSIFPISIWLVVNLTISAYTLAKQLNNTELIFSMITRAWMFHASMGLVVKIIISQYTHVNL